MRRLILSIMLAGALACAPADARGLKDYQRIVWTQQHGAPPDIVALAQTPDGWLWVGSDDGLLRFDGVSFTPYAPPGHPDFAHRRIVELHAADNGDLYVSYFPNDIAIVKRDGSFALLPQPEGYRRTSAMSMVLDMDGSLWTIGHGIRRYANGRWTTVDSGPTWMNEGLYSTMLDGDNRLWAAAPTGVWLLNRERGRFDQVSSQGGGMAMAPDGDVWVNGINGKHATRLAKSASGKPRPARATAASARLAGQFASDGTLWALGCPDTACLVHDVGARGALVPRRDADERVASSEDAAGQEALAFIEDREGNLWVLAHNGLNQFRPKRFLVPGLNLADLFYRAALDGAGQLWVAETVTGKLWRLDADGVPVAEPGPPAHILASGRDGSLLIGDRRSIRRVRAGSVETIALPPGPDGKPVDRVLFGLLDDGERIWTGANDLGGIAWTGGQWRSRAAMGLPERIYFSEAAGPGELWLALSTGELAFHHDGKLTRYDAALVGTATGIFPGEQVLLAGVNGLAVLQDGRLRSLRSDDPDILRSVSGMAVTANGDRWLNGVAGVVRVRAPDWQRALADPGTLLRYESFGVADGYPGRASVALPRPTAFSGDGRHVWFIGTNGIVGLDSANLRRNPVAPQPVVLQVSTDAARFDAGNAVALPPGSDSFRVHFTAPMLRQPERTRFAFRLVGVDADWRDSGNRRTTSYTNVGPGDYVFRVRAFNEDGVASGQDASLRLTIAPTLVQSLPFKLLAIGAGAALLVLLYRLRVRYLTRRITERLEIKLTERERIARTLHDSFLQSVQLLLLRLRQFERKLGDDGKTRDEFHTILADAQHVITEGRDQVHELRVHPDRPLGDIVHEALETLRALHPGVEALVRSEGTAARLTGTVAEEAGAIAGEALRNAFTHGQAHRIVVTIDHGWHGLTVTVQDDGRGIAPDVVAAGQRAGHWGLVGMRERAARIGARLDIDSQSGAGTTVRLNVPPPVISRSEERPSP